MSNWTFADFTGFEILSAELKSDSPDINWEEIELKTEAIESEVKVEPELILGEEEELDEETLNASDWSILANFLGGNDNYRFSYFRETVSDLDRLRNIRKYHVTEQNYT